MKRILSEIDLHGLAKKMDIPEEALVEKIKNPKLFLLNELDVMADLFGKARMTEILFQ